MPHPDLPSEFWPATCVFALSRNSRVTEMHHDTTQPFAGSNCAGSSSIGRKNLGEGYRNSEDREICSLKFSVLSVRKLLKSTSCDGHQLGNARQIPVGSRDLLVAQVGGQHEHGMVHVHTLPIPAQQVLAGKGVA